jgi:hypothetical protein
LSLIRLPSSPSSWSMSVSVNPTGRHNVRMLHVAQCDRRLSMDTTFRDGVSALRGAGMVMDRPERYLGSVETSEFRCSLMPASYQCTGDRHERTHGSDGYYSSVRQSAGKARPQTAQIGAFLADGG